jgi:hypothetical protein
MNFIDLNSAVCTVELFYNLVSTFFVYFHLSYCKFTLYNLQLILITSFFVLIFCIM